MILLVYIYITITHATKIKNAADPKVSTFLYLIKLVKLQSISIHTYTYSPLFSVSLSQKHRGTNDDGWTCWIIRWSRYGRRIDIIIVRETVGSVRDTSGQSNESDQTKNRHDHGNLDR